MLAILVDVDDLMMSVVASVVAGIAVTVVVSLAIWGTTRYVDYNDERRRGAALGALFTGMLGLVLTAVILAVGIVLMVAG